MFLVFSHARVSNRVIARKLERERKKTKQNKTMGGGGGAGGGGGGEEEETPARKPHYSLDISLFGSFVN